MLNDTRALHSSNKGLNNSRGLISDNRGLSDINVKKSILKFFKREDLFDIVLDDNKDNSVNQQNVKTESSKDNSVSSDNGVDNSKKWIGSDIQAAYNLYKDKFSSENEFFNLIKTKDKKQYITKNMIEKYLKDKK